MSAFLGVYHRGNRIHAAAVQPMVDAFDRFETQYLSRLDFPGFILLCLNELQGETVFATERNDAPLIGVVGTVAANVAENLSAADCLAEAWAAQGTACLADLEGAFVAAIYDPITHRLCLANDKFGMRPLFLCITDEYVAFCNEIGPLLRLPGFRFELHTGAVADYFCLGTTLGSETLVKGIDNLPPATFWECAGHSIQVQQYWRANIKIDREATIEQHATRIAEVLKTVVEQMLDQLSNVRCLLSAGADTRLILSCMPQTHREHLLFLTSKLSILKADEDKDLIGATALAKKLGLQHSILEIALSERDFGPEYFDEVQPMRVAKVLGGWHGGEYLGGFCAKAAPIREMLTFEAVDQKLRSVFAWWFRQRLKRHPYAHLQAVIGKMEAEDRLFQFQITQFGRGFFTNIYYGSRGTWLQPFEIINQGFSPFWDSRFLQALLSVPFELVADYQLYNVIFRDCLTELTEIPSNSPLTRRTDSALPPMKEGIEPKVALKPKYQNALAKYLGERATWQRHIYSRRRMRKTLQDGDAPTTMQFIDFEAWLRRFVRF